jgi:hypothetical protein
MTVRFAVGIAVVALMVGCDSNGRSAPPQATPAADIRVTHDDGSLPRRCGVKRTASRVVAFIDAFNRGDADGLDRLIADREHFQWYSSGAGHGTRSRGFTTDGMTSARDQLPPRPDGRPALLRYLANRNRLGERMRLVQVKITRIPPRAWFAGITDEVAGVEYSVTLDAPDFASFPGRNRLAGGKGGFGCSDGRLLAWSMGLDTAGRRLAGAAGLCRVASRIHEPPRRVVACTG